MTKTAATPPLMGVPLLALVFASSAFAATSFFGPKKYVLAPGKPQTFTEAVAVDEATRCDGRAAFTLVIQNGDGKGRNAVHGATIRWNGSTLLSEDDFGDDKKGSLETAIDMRPRNTLEVQLKGGHPGDSLTIAVRREIEEQIGPAKTYLVPAKEDGTSIHQSFHVSDPMSLFTLFFRNGDVSGMRQIKEAKIRLNGVEVLGEGDLKRQPLIIRKPVVLQSENTLSGQIEGKPDSLATIAIERKIDEGVCTPKVLFESPAEGAVLATARLLATGTAVGGKDIGITVNGIPAEIDLSSSGKPGEPFRWFADVPAPSGPLTLDAVAVNSAGVKGEAMRTVMIAAPSVPLAVVAIPPGGIAPLTVTFNIAVGDATPDQRYEMDLDGDGQFETPLATPPDGIDFTFTAPGVHVVRVRASDQNGNATTASTAVCVNTFSTMNAALKRTWSRFLEALVSADLDAVLKQFSDGVTRDKYRKPLTLIKPTMPQFASGMATIQPVWIHANVAHYLLTRTEKGQVVGYHVYFARDSSGVWRIVQF